MYNKPVRKPELFIEKTIDKAREVLETTNDIVNDQSLHEFLLRKGLAKSSVWIFAALVKSKLVKQLCMSILLAEALKRVVDKEIFIQANINGEDKIPSGLTLDESHECPTFKNVLTKLIEFIVLKKFDKEPRTFKNLMMVLFFYRLETMQFYNSLQFEVGTKDYYQGKHILDDILQVPIENPLMFLKVVQSMCNVKFSFEFMRKLAVDKYSFLYNSSPFSICTETEDGEKVLEISIKNSAPVSVRERMYFLMAKLISTNEYNNVTPPGSETEDDESYNSNYSTPANRTQQSSEYEGEEDDEENENEGESYDGSYNSYQSASASKSVSQSMQSDVSSDSNRENSPPFKQAKYDKTDSQAIFNNVYSGRNSLSSNYEHVLRASHANMNMSKNFIENSNHDKKVKYICKKVFLQLPSSLYRFKLSTIELDSFEASRMSVQTKVVEQADFLQSFSILRQNYPLPALDQFTTLIFNIENSLKDVYSLEGDESAFLEIILVNNILLFISEKFEDIVKLMEKVRETLFSLSKCPLEIISVMQLFAGMLFEKENIIESEKEYLMSLIHYFNIVGDPRGRGTYSSNYLLGLAWKSSMIAHYHKKAIDAELCEEILDAALHNLMHSKDYMKDSSQSAKSSNSGDEKKWNKVFDEAPIKNKFVKSVRKSPTKNTRKESGNKINIDDIDVDLLSEFPNESGDPFDDYISMMNEKFLFYHWGTQKDKYEDIEDYMSYGTGNQLDFFVWLLRVNPCMFMSGIKFTNTQIREFTFSDGVNNMLSLKSASSIMSAVHNFSSSMSIDSFSSNYGGHSSKAEKKQRAFHHGAYQHILNKDHYAMSRSECNGVVYVWGSDTEGQLGSSNIANLKSDDMADDFKRSYPRILIGLKDLIIREV